MDNSKITVSINQKSSTLNANNNDLIDVLKNDIKEK